MEGGLWTSGTYLDSQGGFVWAATPTTGTKFNYTQWQIGSPKNNSQGDNDSCVRLIVNSYRNNSMCNWADLNCGEYLPFICSLT